MAYLCEAYWLPVYAYLRKCNYSEDAAKDLTQGFFTRVLEKQYVSRASPDRGRFRSFLLGSLKHYLQDERDRRVAQKRGGQTCVLQIDFAKGEDLYTREPVDPLTPEQIFEKRWASTLVQNVFSKLETEMAASGSSKRFQELKPFLLSTRETPYSELADKLNVNTTSVKVAVHRLRKRYGELFRLEIAGTVGSSFAVEDEIRYLLEILAR